MRPVDVPFCGSDWKRFIAKRCPLTRGLCPFPTPSPPLSLITQCSAAVTAAETTNNTMHFHSCISHKINTKDDEFDPQPMARVLVQSPTYLQLWEVVVFVHSTFCFSGPDNNGSITFVNLKPVIANCEGRVHMCIQTLTRTAFLSMDTCAYYSSIILCGPPELRRKAIARPKLPCEP